MTTFIATSDLIMLINTCRILEHPWYLQYHDVNHAVLYNKLPIMFRMFLHRMSGTRSMHGQRPSDLDISSSIKYNRMMQLRHHVRLASLGYGAA